MGRLADAWTVLRGRHDFQIRSAAQLARIEAEWVAMCSQIQNLLESLNYANDKLRKREERAERKKQAESGPAAEAASALPRFGRHNAPLKLRKRELRRAARQATGTEGEVPRPPVAAKPGETVIEEEQP